jgi:hypothetical protein
MQKHLAASILAAYFPAAFEPSPLVSNVSSPVLPRLVLPYPVFFSRQITNEFPVLERRRKA